jgi:hypothetical protein
MVTARGLGAIGFAVFAAAVCIGLLAERLHHGANTLAMGLGFVAGGVVMRVVGRRANREAPRHRFCEMRMERWVYVFVPLGLLLTWIGLTASGVIRHL